MLGIPDTNFKKMTIKEYKERSIMNVINHKNNIDIKSLGNAKFF